MGKIFINYRRADSQAWAGRIYDHLVPHFGEEAIFMDVSDIDAGLDFVKVLKNAVHACDVLVVLIGKQCPYPDCCARQLFRSRHLL